MAERLGQLANMPEKSVLLDVSNVGMAERFRQPANMEKFVLLDVSNVGMAERLEQLLNMLEKFVIAFTPIKLNLVSDPK